MRELFYEKQLYEIISKNKSVVVCCKQHGAAEARRAHNPEDPRSKRGVANIFL